MGRGLLELQRVIGFNRRKCLQITIYIWLLRFTSNRIPVCSQIRCSMCYVCSETVLEAMLFVGRGTFFAYG